MENRMDQTFKKWKKRLKSNHINAICKPCWELNYCPYGSLVEDFPVTENDAYRCRIFGHECPVFYVAEPFTETKKLRNISRNIPQAVKFKVFRRDNQVCQQCGKNVAFDEINFDHIIPWSKGGSSDESNIRILCESCNKKRGANFEDESLTPVFKEIFHEPININLEMLEDLLRMVLLWKFMQKGAGDTPTEENFCHIIHSEDLETDKFMYCLVSQIAELLIKDPSFLNVKKKMNALSYRWGIKDGESHSVIETCKKFNFDLSYYVNTEMLLLRRLGFVLEGKLQESHKYYELKTDLIGFI